MRKSVTFFLISFLAINQLNSQGDIDHINALNNLVLNVADLEHKELQGLSYTDLLFFSEFMGFPKIENQNHVRYYKYLRKLKVIKRDSLSIHIKDTLDFNNTVEINLESKRFHTNEHRITYTDYSTVDSIDGKQAEWGHRLNFHYPNTEIAEFKILLNDSIIVKSFDYFSNFYDTDYTNVNTNWCFGVNFYYDKQTKLIHAFLPGGALSGAYFLKLIIDLEGNIDKYFLHYGHLSEWGLFYYEYPGF